MPSPDGPYAYGIRFAHGAEHPMLIRTDRDGGNETVLLDANAMAEGKAYFHLGGSAHSPDHRLLAYAIDEMGSEYFEIRIRDLDTGEDLPDRIAGTSGAPVWAADSRTLLYVQLDANHRPAKVLPPHRRHRPVGGCRRPRGCQPVLFPRRRQDPVRPLHRHRQPRPRDVGGPFPPGRQADGATPKLVAPRRRSGEVRRRRGRRRLLHPHQCRRRRGLQDRHRAGCDPRPRALAGPRPAPARAG